MFELFILFISLSFYNSITFLTLLNRETSLKFSFPFFLLRGAQPRILRASNDKIKNATEDELELCSLATRKIDVEVSLHY